MPPRLLDLNCASTLIDLNCASRLARGRGQRAQHVREPVRSEVQRDVGEMAGLHVGVRHPGGGHVYTHCIYIIQYTHII